MTLSELLLGRGTGVHRQRRAYTFGGRITDVVAHLVQETAACGGTTASP